MNTSALLPDVDELIEVVSEVLDELAETLDHPFIEPSSDSTALSTTEAHVTMNASDFVVEFAIRVPDATARVLGAAMLRMSVDEMEQEDVDDAIGELGNLLGGGVKSLLDEETFLGVPVTSHAVTAVADDGFSVVQHELGSLGVRLAGADG